MSNMSILGLYTYDSTIFDNIILPSEIDKDILVNNILMEYAELEVLYPNPSFIKEAIRIWSSSRIHTWERMAEVLYEKYDPFINIKRDEVRTITQERDLHGTGTGTDKIIAWNDTNFTDRSKNDTSSTETGTITTTEHFHVEGDSAITDAQDVAKKEIDLRRDYDIYNIIKKEFKQRFLLMIY